MGTQEFDRNRRRFQAQAGAASQPGAAGISGLIPVGNWIARAAEKSGADPASLERARAILQATTVLSSPNC